MKCAFRSPEAPAGCAAGDEDGCREAVGFVAAVQVDMPIPDLPLLGPGGRAEEFRRRAGLSSRDLKSCARVFLDWLLDPST